MTNKQKNLIFTAFYEEFKMPDKMNYIKKVIDSCENRKQLLLTIDWGIKSLWRINDQMTDKIHKIGVGIWEACAMSMRITNMTSVLNKELIKFFDIKLKSYDAKQTEY